MSKKNVKPNEKTVSDEDVLLKKKIKSKIVKACKGAGTYNASFDMVISDLADILVMRESAIKTYKANGNAAIVKHINVGGNVNLAKNPAVSIIIEINQLALAYWRELGLTPKGFKALGAEVVNGNEEDTFEKLLEELGI